MIFCDMDGVLVHMLGPEGFDKFPWMPGGRDLWEFLKPSRPLILTQVKDERYGTTCMEKLTWVKRELGEGVGVIFAPRSVGKGVYARAGDILVDDSASHCRVWEAAGGTPLRHLSADMTIRALVLLGHK